MSVDSDILPEFANPPVNETALSIQFAPIGNLGVPHLGLYWEKIRPQFSQFQVHPAIPSVTEQIDVPFRAPRLLGIKVIAQPEVRCWFLDSSGTRLIQVQRDRFIYNWRQVTGADLYPRYPTIRAELENEWEKFCAFLASENLQSPQVNQCEVTYVNHIDYDKGWKGYAELNYVIAAWSGKGSENFLPPPERVNMEAHFRLPNGLGRLHVSVEPVIRARDSKEVLQLTMTARGAPKSSSLVDVLSWLDLGRKWVVKGFADFTTAAMHDMWGRKI